MAIRLECILVVTQQKPNHDQNARDARKIWEQVLHFISSAANLCNSRTLSAGFSALSFQIEFDIGASSKPGNNCGRKAKSILSKRPPPGERQTPRSQNSLTLLQFADSVM